MGEGILIWVLLWNLVAFLLMGLDKWQARAGGRRIRERTLFLGAILGGSVGAILGMQLFRHKTLHLSFRIGMPAILAAQIFLAGLVSYWYFFVR